MKGGPELSLRPFLHRDLHLNLNTLNKLHSTGAITTVNWLESLNTKQTAQHRSHNHSKLA